MKTLVFDNGRLCIGIRILVVEYLLRLSVRKVVLIVVMSGNMLDIVNLLPMEDYRLARSISVNTNSKRIIQVILLIWILNSHFVLLDSTPKALKTPTEWP